MSIPAKSIYKTTNWHDYNRALRQRGSLTVWFDPAMVWEAAPTDRRVRQQVYSDAASLTIKVLFGMALRQATGFVASLLKLAGFDWSVPDFSTLSRRQKILNVVTLTAIGSTKPIFSHENPKTPTTPAPHLVR